METFPRWKNRSAAKPLETGSGVREEKIPLRVGTAGEIQKKLILLECEAVSVDEDR